MEPSKRTAKKHTSKQSATMQDIADRLNLSVATVSRALRRVPGINPKTRSLVLQMASELGYRLSQSYRNAPLEKEALQHVGVFIETTHEDLPPYYLTGLIDATIHLNASPVIHYVKPGECANILDPKRQPSAMRSGLLSGAILIYWWPNQIVRQLSQQMPVVSIMHQYPGVEADMVGIDNETGMQILVNQLHQQGHRRIGFFGHCKQLQWSNARLGGFAAALIRLGLEFRQEDVLSVRFEDMTHDQSDWSQYTDIAEAGIHQGVTAWVCATEPGGWNLHRQLTARGFRIPEDVSITGFHRPNQAVADQADLTSVSASYEAIGAAALRRLLHRIQNPLETPRTILFPCEPYAGQTIGPAPVPSDEPPARQATTKSPRQRSDHLLRSDKSSVRPSATPPLR